MGACYDVMAGGFSKAPDVHPDILHTFYSTCWLSLAEVYDFKRLNVELGIVSDKR